MQDPVEQLIAAAAMVRVGIIPASVLYQLAGNFPATLDDSAQNGATAQDYALTGGMAGGILAAAYGGAAMYHAIGGLNTTATGIEAAGAILHRAAAIGIAGAGSGFLIGFGAGVGVGLVAYGAANAEPGTDAYNATRMQMTPETLMFMP